jgi:hypothetical protein
LQIVAWSGVDFDAKTVKETMSEKKTVADSKTSGATVCPIFSLSAASLKCQNIN